MSALTPLNTLTAIGIGLIAGGLLVIAWAGEAQRVEPTVVVGNCSAPVDTYEVVVSRTWMRSDGALVQQCNTHLDLYSLHRDYTR